MGLSNYLPSSRISQAGVVPNAAARPASPYEGQMVYELDTNRLLIWDGAVWVAPNSTTANPPGLELVTGVGCSAGGTASNGVVTIGSAVSTVTVTNAFSANYDNYRIIFDSVFSVNGARIFLRGTGSTGTTYAGNFYFMDTSSATVFGATNGSNAYFDIALSSSTGRTNVVCDIFNPNTTGVATRTVSQFSGHQYNGHGGGRDSSTNASTAFDLLPASGTLTGGTIRVYGYRNS